MSDLADHIRHGALIDTHEHLAREPDYLKRADILHDLFANYVTADLVVAGAAPEAVERLVGGAADAIAERFNAVREPWERCQHTGYGEAVRTIAREVYGIEQITAEALEAAAPRAADLHRPGERLRLLRDVAGLDHVQVDDFSWPCPPDESGPAFFLYDVNWMTFVTGKLDAEMLDRLREHTGVAVKDLATLREAMGLLFERYAPCAIAVKTQHAYQRTLAWEPRDDADASRVLDRALAGGSLSKPDRLCLGDWALARGVELAIQHNLPVKIHTGYYASHSHMPMQRIRPSLLSDLLLAYPEARFVLMHIGYPYGSEIIALAKHFPNAYADLCWAWSIDPQSASEFVTRFIHAAPANKLFVFGGDIQSPIPAVAYARQCRWWLTRALEERVDAGMLTEKQAMRLADRWMRENQRECFDIEGTRAAIRAAMAETGDAAAAGA